MALDTIQDEMLALSGPAAKAWVYLDGVSATAAILDSYGISSIVDNGTGSYDINFTNSFSDTSFAIVTGAARAGEDVYASENLTNRTTSVVRIVTRNSSGTVVDSYVSLTALDN